MGHMFKKGSPSKSVTNQQNHNESLSSRVVRSASGLAHDAFSSRFAASEALATRLQAEEKAAPRLSPWSSSAGPSTTSLLQQKTQEQTGNREVVLPESFRSCSTDNPTSTSGFPEGSTEYLPIRMQALIPCVPAQVPPLQPIQEIHTHVAIESNKQAAEWTSSFEQVHSISPNIYQVERVDGAAVSQLLSDPSTSLVEATDTTAENHSPVLLTLNSRFDSFFSPNQTKNQMFSPEELGVFQQVVQPLEPFWEVETALRYHQESVANTSPANATVRSVGQRGKNPSAALDDIKCPIDAEEKAVERLSLVLSHMGKKESSDG